MKKRETIIEGKNIFLKKKTYMGQLMTLSSSLSSSWAHQSPNSGPIYKYLLH